MMNRKKTKKAGLIKYALILPVTLTLILWSNAEVVSSSVHTIVENLAVETQQEEPVWVMEVEQRPQHQRGWTPGLIQFLNENIRYPQAALTNGVRGQVQLHFVVETDGSVNDVQVRGGDEVFYDEATRLMRLTSWQPGRQGGRAVRVRQAVTLVFYVENGEGRLLISPPPPPPPSARAEQRTAPPPPPPPPPPPAQRSGTMEIQQNPEFPGGRDAKMQFLSRNILYPAIATENGVQGRVVVEFVVNETGEITNARVVESINPALDREAVRVINAMPNWTPGEQGGNRVSTLVTQGIVFRLQGVDDERFNQISMDENDLIVTAFGRQRRAE